MLKNIAFTSMLTLISMLSYGQALELGLFIGGSNYQGDLASSEFKVIVKQTDVALGGFLRYNINDFFSLKLQLVHTELKADDTNSSLEALQQRNLRFFSPLLDASLRLEWYFLESLSGYQQTLLPYLSIGGSFFTFNPQAIYQNQLYELQPLRTEGQGLPSFPGRQPYRLSNGSILAGLGIKFPINDDLTLGIDFSAHYTFTDYLDDVSTTYANYNDLLGNFGRISADIAYQVDDFFDIEQTSPLPNTARGNPNLNDLFFLFGFTISYNIINPARLKGGGIGCPRF